MTGRSRAAPALELRSVSLLRASSVLRCHHQRAALVGGALLGEREQHHHPAGGGRTAGPTSGMVVIGGKASKAALFRQRARASA